MKILMLTPYLPYPPSSGGQVRSYNLIKHLSKHHEIHLVALIKSDRDKQHVRHLTKYCTSTHVCKRSKSPWTLKNILSSVLGFYPFLVVRNYSSQARSTIKTLLKTQSFDLIHAETFYIMPHIPPTNIPILLVEQTIEYKVYQHFVDTMNIPLIPLLLKIDILKLKYWEKTFWKKADLVGAVSLEDKKSMRKLVPNLDIEIIPNAAGDDLLELFGNGKKSASPNFFYLGNYLWLQNVEAATILAHKVFPEIKKVNKKATCVIAGQHADEKIKHLEGNGIKIVNVLDPTKDNPRLFKSSSIFIAPIEGPGGTRLKILGAMASGLPVISSPTGTSGLAIEDGKNILIARNAKEFSQKAKDLLTHPTLYKVIQVNARKLIEKHYTYNAVASHLESVYKTLIKTTHENRN